MYRIEASGSKDPLMGWIERQSGKAVSPILLEKLDQLSVEGANHLVLIGKMLVVSKPRELITLDLSDPSRRKRVIKHDVEEVAGLEEDHRIQQIFLSSELWFMLTARLPA